MSEQEGGEPAAAGWYRDPEMNEDAALLGWQCMDRSRRADLLGAEADYRGD